MQLSPHQRSNLQANTVLADMANPYPHNLSPSLVTRSSVAHQFHAPEVNDVAMDLSRNATSVGIAGGSISWGGLRDGGVALAGRRSSGKSSSSCWGRRWRTKSRRTGEQEEPQSPTNIRSITHEATMLLPMTVPSGLSGYRPCDPPREPSRERHKETAALNIRVGGPERRSPGGDGDRPARASSPRNHSHRSGRSSASQSPDSSDPYGSRSDSHAS